MKKKCLIAVQGPTEFITAFISFQWYEKEIAKELCNVVLLVYDTTMEESKESMVFDVIKKLATGREWDDIVFLNSSEMKALSHNRYSKSISLLRKKLSFKNFDTVLVSRNFGSFGTHIILDAYPNAFRIEYGDSFGMVGNSEVLRKSLSDFLKSPVKIIKTFLKKLIYNHFPREVELDQSILVMPLDWKGDFDEQKLRIPNKDFVLKEFQKLSLGLTELNDFCHQLIDDVNGKCSLYLLSNFTNSNFSSFENEFELYKNIIRETAESGSTIILKNHPRSSEIMLDLLYKDLGDEYQVKIINNQYSYYPIELWGGLIDRCSVYPVFSSSVISLKYFFSKRVFMSLDQFKINKYIDKNKIEEVIQSEKMSRQAIENLESWDEKSFLWQGTDKVL